jgi:hypothetical protein
MHSLPFGRSWDLQKVSCKTRTRFTISNNAGWKDIQNTHITSKAFPVPFPSQGLNCFFTDWFAATNSSRTRTSRLGTTSTPRHSKPNVAGFTVWVAVEDCEANIIIAVSFAKDLTTCGGRSGRGRTRIEKRVTTFGAEKV